MRDERDERTDDEGDADGTGPADGTGTAESGEDGASGGVESPDDEPLSELAERIRRSRRAGAASDAATEDPFAALERGVTGPEPDEEAERAGEEAESASSETTGPAAPGATDGTEDPFEQVDVGDVDGAELWASLADETEAEAGRPSVGAAGAVETVDGEGARAERTEHVVPKADYCQQCQFFAEPPAVECTHEGTTIVEVVDADRFRVRGCPMVERADAVDRGSTRDEGGD